MMNLTSFFYQITYVILYFILIMYIYIRKIYCVFMNIHPPKLGNDKHNIWFKTKRTNLRDIIDMAEQFITYHESLHVRNIFNSDNVTCAILVFCYWQQLHWFSNAKLKNSFRIWYSYNAPLVNKLIGQCRGDIALMWYVVAMGIFPDNLVLWVVIQMSLNFI